MRSELNALWARLRALQRNSPANWPSTGWNPFVTTFATAGTSLGPTASPCPQSSPSSAG